MRSQYIALSILNKNYKTQLPASTTLYKSKDEEFDYCE